MEILGKAGSRQIEVEISLLIIYTTVLTLIWSYEKAFIALCSHNLDLGVLYFPSWKQSMEDGKLSYVVKGT